MSASASRCFICGRRLGTEVRLADTDHTLGSGFCCCVECYPHWRRADACLSQCHRWGWRHPQHGETRDGSAAH